MIALAIVIDPALAAKISALALVVGTLGTVVQALLQKPWWTPKVKWVLSWVWAVLFGVAAYVVANGVPTELSDIQAVFAFVVGAYASIRIAYTALKVPVVDKIEEQTGLGANETPKGVAEEPEDADGYKPLSQVPDPYANRQDPLV
jgi:uncharacterized membrane protein